MNMVLMVALGGAVGAVARFGLSRWVMQVTAGGYPWGTLVVNVLGSLLIGVLFIVLQQQSEAIRLMLIAGFLGALTTFSTFSLEVVLLLESGNWSGAMWNVGLNVVLCVLSVGLGMTLARGYYAG
jgi:fluoride exporter